MSDVTEYKYGMQNYGIPGEHEYIFMIVLGIISSNMLLFLGILLLS